MEKRYDFLVIGSGIAGLFYALEVAVNSSAARIAIVTKKEETDTSTNRAQGGIAAVMAGTDSFESHVKDTLQAGCGLCKKDVVENVVGYGPLVIEELVKYGVRFTRNNNDYDLGREGGHNAHRVVHAADFTGREIERALLAACRSLSNIDFYRDHIALDLMTYSSGGEKRCAGAFIFSEKKKTFHVFYAPATMLASGGLGQCYYHNTNPRVATGDGVAMAYRAGVPVGNLEFIQFHPTSLYTPGRWPFLISEAVRGEGARLKSVNGIYFMDNAHPLKELAPRDIVARAIDKELKQSGEEYVLLDISHVDAERIKKRFPNIYKECLRRGFDMTKRSIPVVPAAHYSCGGVVSNINGETELKGLFTAGETAMTGMHGANRLASNSLLEAVVMARLGADRSVEYSKDNPLPDNVECENSPCSSLYPQEKIFIAHERRQVKRIMSDFVGIVRTEERLNIALEKVQAVKDEIEKYYLSNSATYNVIELRNIATVAELIVRCALSRKESRGLHCIEDYPDLSGEPPRDSIIVRDK